MAGRPVAGQPRLAGGANPASCRVAERAGYPVEGTLRESHRYGDGRRYDEHLHARLATD
ncbi:GNAT family N-acetyltransferase [Micromonospora craniellae]|uniref:GNAT family N-acetyltransferase n=1 Tax=Micromonospora craniellae TaxID=2294034 RepID=UPI001CC7EB26|nr:GNAT family protein [Micromonospora craniellae]